MGSALPVVLLLVWLINVITSKFPARLLPGSQYRDAVSFGCHEIPANRASQAHVDSPLLTASAKPKSPPGSYCNAAAT